MATTLVIATAKGGCGKSTTALAIADVLINNKKKVLFLDTDPQRNSTTVYGAKIEGVPTLLDIFNPDFDIAIKDCVQKTEYGDIIAGDNGLAEAETAISSNDPSRLFYVKGIVDEIGKDYDYIIIDTPPGTGILLSNALMAADYVIVPVTCDTFGTQGLHDFWVNAQRFLKANSKLKVLGLLKVKYKGRRNLTRAIEEEMLPEMAKQMNSKVFEQTIRESVKCQEAQTAKVALSKYDGKCTTAIDYEKFVKEEILGRKL